MVKIKYVEVSGFQFSQAMQKISTTPTHGQKASLIHKLSRRLSEARNKVSKEYQEQIAEKFGKRDEVGKLIRPEGEPGGFEPIEEQEKELIAAQDAFGEQILELDLQPLTLDTLSDFKISAQDLEALKGVYAGNSEFEKPAVPADAGLKAVK